MSFPRDEVEQAFQNYFTVGIVNEDWVAWSKLFTDDATYHDHFWGTFRGPAEIERHRERTVTIESVNRPTRRRSSPRRETTV